MFIYQRPCTIGIHLKENRCIAPEYSHWLVSICRHNNYKHQKGQTDISTTGREGWVRWTQAQYTSGRVEEKHRLVIKHYCNNKMTKQHDNSQTIQQQLKHQTYRHLEITVLASLIKCHFLIVCSFLLQIWFSWCTAGIHGQAKPSFPRAESIQSQLESRWHTVGLLFMDSLNNK